MRFGLTGRVALFTAAIVAALPSPTLFAQSSPSQLIQDLVQNVRDPRSASPGAVSSTFISTID